MSMWTLGMSHTYTHTHTHLYQRFKVLFSEVVTSATSQQPHKPCCIVMATVCHSEHGDNKAPYKHYVLNIKLSSCHRACFMGMFHVLRRMRGQWKAKSHQESTPGTLSLGSDHWATITFQPTALSPHTIPSNIFAAEARGHEVILPNCIVFGCFET